MPRQFSAQSIKYAKVAPETSGVSRKSVRGGDKLRFLPTYRWNVVRIAYLDGGALRSPRPLGGRIYLPSPP